MTSISKNNKRIVQNTLFLYIRTLVIMVITLYTSRVILNILGVTDYGIYNIVGGAIMMFSVLSSSFSSAISRFIMFELGKKHPQRLNLIFSTSVNIQLVISLVTLLLGETVGIWFLNYEMNIPPERMEAANWVLHCSLIAFAISLISIPYNASIIAHEKMKVFAYISILEATLKLLIVYMLYISPFDKLSTYAVMLTTVAIIIRLTYGIYCKRRFEECNYHFVYNKAIVREMGGFAGWSSLSNATYMINTQGINILINIFFGVTLNAARGIAIQVENAVLQLVNNFTTAINPQITKSYASGDIDYMTTLICRGAKYSCLLLLFFVIPFVLETDTILRIWLKEVPEYTSAFLKLLMISTFLDTLGKTTNTAVAATGRIKHYQIWVTFVGCQTFLLTWIAFKLGCPAISTYIIYIGIYFILIFVRICCLRRQVCFSTIAFVKQVLYKLLIVSISAFLFPFIIVHYMEPSFLRLIITCIISTIATCYSIYLFGLEKQEKKFLTEKIKTYMQKIISKEKSISNPANEYKQNT